MQYKINTLFGRVGQDLAGFALQIDRDNQRSGQITDNTNITTFFGRAIITDKLEVSNNSAVEKRL